MTKEAAALLRAPRSAPRQLQRETGTILRQVLHRDGKAIKSFRRAWKTACTKAGVPGMIRHDMWRSGVRNMPRAGIPERVCMVLGGHKTRSVSDRYNIVSDGDLRDAAAKLDSATVTKNSYTEPRQGGQRRLSAGNTNEPP